MQKFESVVEDAVAFHAAALEFSGEFFFEPFGIEATTLTSAAALYAMLLVLALLARRAVTPVYRAHRRAKIVEYDFGRNH